MRVRPGKGARRRQGCRTGGILKKKKAPKEEEVQGKRNRGRLKKKTLNYQRDGWQLLEYRGKRSEQLLKTAKITAEREFQL